MFWNVRAMPSAVICVRRHAGDVRLRRTRLARGRLVDAGQHVEEGRLAGAVRADQADDRAARDREVDVVDGDEAAELLAQPGSPRARLVAVGASRSLLLRARRAGASSPPVLELGLAPLARDQALRAGRASSGTSRIPKIRNSYFGMSTSATPTRRQSLTRSPSLSRPCRFEDSGRIAPHHHALDVPHAAEDDHAEDEDRDVEEEARREHRADEERSRRPRRRRRPRRSRTPSSFVRISGMPIADGGDLVLADRDPGAPILESRSREITKIVISTRITIRKNTRLRW